MTIQGEQAEIRWGYHSAARLGKWKAAREKGETSAAFTATVLEHDAFRMAQSPLKVIIRTTAGTWKWPMTDVQITVNGSGSTLSARVTEEG